MKLTEFSGRPNLGAAHQGPLTVGAAAATLVSLTGALHAQTRLVLITVETNPVRMTVNGTDPTAALGFNYAAGTEILLSLAEAASAKFIRAGGADTTLQVAQYLE